MKKAFVCAGKIMAAGIIAFAILNGFALFYYNIPITRYDEDSVTYQKYSGHAWYCQMKEGFGYGRINNDGYSNSEDFSPDKPVDILIMGSSQVEAFQVPRRESMTALLNAGLGDTGRAYNTGTGGYTFAENLKHVDNALAKYRPRGFLVLETDRLDLSERELNEILGGVMNPPVIRRNGIWGILKRFPYFTLAHVQYDEYRNENKTSGIMDAAGPSGGASDIISDSYEELLDRVVAGLAGSARKNGVCPVVLYHPPLAGVSEDALAFHAPSERIKAVFAAHGVTVLDMSDRFLSEYRKKHVLPYGFGNTAVGIGHLNKYGHAMIADELRRLVMEVE